MLHHFCYNARFPPSPEHFQIPLIGHPFQFSFIMCLDPSAPSRPFVSLPTSTRKGVLLFVISYPSLPMVCQNGLCLSHAEPMASANPPPSRPLVPNIAVPCPFASIQHTSIPKLSYCSPNPPRRRSARELRVALSLAARARAHGRSAARWEILWEDLERR